MQLRSLALALLALWFAALAPMPAGAQGLAFVLNSGQASLSLIDVQQRRELRRVPLLREPHHMALSPDGKSLLVGDTGANAIFFLDPLTGAVQKRLPVSDPYQLQFSPDGKCLTVAGLARNQIDIYDAASLQLAHRIPAAAMPSHMNYAPDSRVVYVSLQQTDRLVAIEVASGRVLWNAVVGSTPAGVLWHDGAVLVALMGADDVAVVDPVDGHVERRVVTGRGAHNMFVSPDARLIYVANRVDGSIAALDAASLAVQRSFRVSGGPDDLDFAPDGTIWVTRRFAHSIGFLDPRSGQYTTLEVGRSPHGIWLDTHMPAPTRISMNAGAMKAGGP